MASTQTITELVKRLEDDKAGGRFGPVIEDDVFNRFLKDFLCLPEIGWESLAGSWNPILRFLELSEKVRLYVFRGGMATDERVQREARNDSIVILDLAIVTNFDYWEVWHKGNIIAQYNAAQFATDDFSAPTAKWQELVSILAREAIACGQYLAHVDELARSKEDLIEPLLRQFERLREEIGSFLIKDPRALKLLKITDKDDDGTLNAIVQRMIDRFIIFKFAEDNRILPSSSPQPLRTLYYQHLRSEDESKLKGQRIVWGKICGVRTRKKERHPGLFEEFAEKYNGGIFLPLNGAKEDIIYGLPLTDWHVKRIYEKIVNIPFQQELAKIIGFIYEKYICKKLYIKAFSKTNPERNQVVLENTPEKKNQGIYYTPEDVCNYIVDNTVGVLILELDRKLDAAMEKEGQEKVAAVLAVFEEARQTTVCDPACGGGSFLVPALARFRTFYSRLHTAMDKVKVSEKDPNRDVFRKALRQLEAPGVFALNWNIYGVDIDPKAVEICSVSLMIQVINELRPKNGDSTVRFPSIMGENIKCGDSLISGVKRDAAGRALGDFFQEKERFARLVALRKELRESASDERKYELHRLISEVAEPVIKSLNANLTDFFRNPTEARAFHWEMEFPELYFNPDGSFKGDAGGLTAVIANPPWDIVKPYTQEFFDVYDPEFRTLSKQDAEKRIKQLCRNPTIANRWQEHLSTYEAKSAFFRGEAFHHQGGGDLNLYKLFTERFHALARGDGYFGAVIPSGVYTDEGTQGLRRLLFTQNRVRGLFSFINRHDLFKGVHNSFKFALLTVQKGGETDAFPCAFMLRRFDELKREPLIVRVDQIRRFSPDTEALMEFTAKEDIAVADKTFLAAPLLGEVREGDWHARFLNELHMTNDSDLFNNRQQGWWLYEGRIVNQFDHTAFGYVSGHGRSADWREPTWNEKPTRENWRPQWWVAGRNASEHLRAKYGDPIPWRVAVCDVTAPENSRTLLATVVPKHGICAHSLNVGHVLDVSHDEEAGTVLYLTAMLNSFVLDFCARPKIKLHASLFILYQLPMPRLRKGDATFDSLVVRAARLVCYTEDFAGLWEQAAGTRWTRRSAATAPDTRAQLRAEIDALVARQFGLTRPEFAHVLSKFPLIPDEVKQRTLLEFDKLK
ncbi:MAG: hypothetical protein HYU36_14295 [Planctomycetes bacterium]|nr:hypothetical protein [Planctomycetota bacterium]